MKTKQRTDKAQSKRLLEIGLNPRTASDEIDSDTPSWTIGDLIDLLPTKPFGNNVCRGQASSVRYNVSKFTEIDDASVDDDSYEVIMMDYITNKEIQSVISPFLIDALFDMCEFVFCELKNN